MKVNVHSPERCKGETCAIHNPSHHMASFPIVIRLDRGGMVERTCPHGVGHPDPDSVRWLESHNHDVGGFVHGCCAEHCCVESPLQLVDFVAQALRIHDGAHTKGAAEIAEIALRAASEYFEQQADSTPSQTSRTLRLVVADQLKPR
ncbi:hypothetical protein [Streptomyces sp. NPDC017448]|uniref:hypothetical protein n=1 Tax=Streptomyces sp. NPDC017448 TaxID=3364996 RepID=UPI0037B9BD87